MDRIGIEPICMDSQKPRNLPERPITIKRELLVAVLFLFINSRVLLNPHYYQTTRLSQNVDL